MTGLVLLALLLFSACAPAGAPTSAPKLPREGAAAPAVPSGALSPPALLSPAASAAAVTPKTGGTLNLRYQTPVHLDPHRSGAMSYSLVSYGITYQSLLRLSDEKDYGKLEVKPYLAESWSHPDSTTYVFSIRKGVKWQNVPPVSGREFTADDVVYSMKRLTQPDPRFVMGGMLDELSAVDVVDKYTVRMTTKYASFPFLHKLGLADGSVMVPRELDDAAIARTAIGTGPHLLERWDRDVLTKFKKNPNYWENGKPYLDMVNVHHIMDEGSILAAARVGRLDIVDLSIRQVEPIRKTNPELRIERYPGNTQTGIGLQSERKPFSDKRMRQAVRYGLDMQAFIDILVEGQGKPNPALWWWMDHALPQEEIPKRDVSKARQLVKDAGYPNGVKVAGIGSAVRDKGEIAILEIMKDQLREVGIQVDIQPEEEAKLRVRRNEQHDFDIYSFWSPAFEIPERFHKSFIYGSSVMNYIRYKNTEVDALIQQAERAQNAEERGKALIAYQRKVLEEVPYVWLFTPYSYTAQQPYVKGFRNSVMRFGRWQTIADFWLER
ncbi:MAG: ABC transporter substrate-binding protein [Chloroflexi bacterium]|nr:ABC transporter substrate-binding protein [Chloroflexota bacterium]